MSKKSFHSLYWLLILALLLGVVIYWLSSRIIHTTDAQRYAILANNLLADKGFKLGGWPELIYPPGYSFVVIPFLLVGLSLGTSVAVVSALSLALLLVITYKICKKHFDGFTAPVFSVLLVMNGHVVYYSLLGMVEPVWLVLVLASYYLTLVNAKWNYPLAGVLAGIAYLIKPETLAYLVLYLLISLVIHKKPRKYISYMIVVLVFVVGYSLWLYRNSGVLTFSGKSATIYWDSFIENGNLRQYELTYHLNDDFSVGYTIKNANPVAIDLVTRLTINAKYLKLALFELLLPFKLTLVAVVFAIFKLRANKRLLLALGILTLPTLSVLMFHIENRYLSVLLVVIVFILSLAVTSVNKTVFDRVASLIIAIALITLTYYSYWPLKTELTNLLVERNKLKSDLIKIDITNQLVISTKPVYAYYLGKDYYPLPWVEDYPKYSEFFANYSDFVLILDSWSQNTMPEAEKYIITHAKELGLRNVENVEKSSLSIFEND